MGAKRPMKVTTQPCPRLVCRLVAFALALPRIAVPMAQEAERYFVTQPQ